MAEFIEPLTSTTMITSFASVWSVEVTVEDEEVEGEEEEEEDEGDGEEAEGTEEEEPCEENSRRSALVTSIALIYTFCQKQFSS
jgi:hypothetical protein